MTAGRRRSGGRRSRRAGRGVSGVETLLALPILLFVGLGAIQLALVYRAQHALTFGLTEAARAGSLSNADRDAIREGLARGLLPWLHGAGSIADYRVNLMRARAHVVAAQAGGWLRLEQQSPTPASFEDWAEPALDAGGEPIPGLLEIPNDNLVHRASRMRPASGISGMRAGEPVGRVSGQTLADANLLRLRLEYGAPLAVPVVGRLIAATLRAWNGCEPGRASRHGLVALPASGPLASPERRSCAFYGTPGSGPARLPISASATLRMQSPARESDATADAVSGGSDWGGGAELAGAERPPDPGAPPGPDAGAPPVIEAVAAAAPRASFGGSIAGPARAPPTAEPTDPAVCTAPGP